MGERIGPKAKEEMQRQVLANIENAQPPREDSMARMTEQELAEIRMRHEQGERIFGDDHFVHADRRKLLAELDAVTRERDEARHLVRKEARKMIAVAEAEAEQRGKAWALKRAEEWLEKWVPRKYVDEFLDHARELAATAPEKPPGLERDRNLAEALDAAGEKPR